METQPSKSLHRISSLDGMRGLSCILILLGHTWKNGHMILPATIVVMDSFFALSGFLITCIVLAEFEKSGTISLLNFWKRRAIRLLPPFYFFFSFVTVVYLISKFKPIIGTDETVTLFSTAFYASNWALGKGYELGIFGITWSLSLEEQFYFLCPVFLLLILKYFDKKYLVPILLLMIVGISFHRYDLFHELLPLKGMRFAWHRCYVGLDTRTDSLLIGTLGAILYRLYGDKVKVGLLLPSIGIIIFLATLTIQEVPFALHQQVNSIHTDFMMAVGFPLFATIFLILVVHLVQHPLSGISKFLSHKFLVKIGMMSYSIYLWHTVSFGSMEILLKSFNQSDFLWVIKTLIKFCVAYFLGYLSYTYVEKPILRYLANKQKYAVDITKTDQGRSL